MSDTEVVIIPRAKKGQPVENPAPKIKDTKPEIAREKLKEKRERLKKEKENMIIEEAKKRLASDFEKKQIEEIEAQKQEEEKKKSDPSYALLMKMEQMMNMFNHQTKVQSKEELPPAPVKKRASTKKVPVFAPESDEEEKPKKVVKPKEPKPVENVPKRKKKVVYLREDPVPEESTKFVGYDIAPPQEPIQYQPSSGLLSAMMGRRNMNSFYSS